MAKEEDPAGVPNAAGESANNGGGSSADSSNLSNGNNNNNGGGGGNTTGDSGLESGSTPVSELSAASTAAASSSCNGNGNGTVNRTEEEPPALPPRYGKNWKCYIHSFRAKKTKFVLRWYKVFNFFPSQASKPHVDEHLHNLFVFQQQQQQQQRQCSSNDLRRRNSDAPHRSKLCQQKQR